MHDVRSYLDHLASQAHADGGWGYAPDQPAHLEPTCLGLLALSLEPKAHRDIFEKARAALESCAVGDGTYRLERGREEALWPTALVLFVQSVLGGEPGASATGGEPGASATGGEPGASATGGHWRAGSVSDRSDSGRSRSRLANANGRYRRRGFPI
jgi:hypothetical protein